MAGGKTRERGIAVAAGITRTKNSPRRCTGGRRSRPSPERGVRWGNHYPWLSLPPR
jgi:hypothetical protein